MKFKGGGSIIQIALALWAFSREKGAEAATIAIEQPAEEVGRWVVEAHPGREEEAKLEITQAGGTVEASYGCLIQAIISSGKVNELVGKESIRRISEPMVFVT